jgi:hypothetical protein
MKLADARKLAIRDRISIRFPLTGGQECVVDMHGVARVPGLSAPPQFNLEDEFAAASTFTLDAGTPAARPRVVDREGLEKLVAATAVHADADHDE